MLVDNDVNVMALGEARLHDPSEQIVVVKAGSGIGLAYVTQGTVQRGAQGSAGEIGHIRAPAGRGHRVPLRQARLPRGGGGRRVDGGAAERARDRVRRSGRRRPPGARRRAGGDRDGPRGRSRIGFVLATVVNVLNPSRLVVAGDLTEARDYLFSALRETVYRDAGTLATVELEITPARAGARAGLIGATTMAVEHVLAPTAG